MELDRREWLSTGQAGRIIGISPQWAYKLAREGKLKSIETPLGLLVRREAAIEYARRRAERPTHHAKRAEEAHTATPVSEAVA